MHVPLLFFLHPQKICPEMTAEIILGYNTLQQTAKVLQQATKQSTIDLPHMNLVIFLPQHALPLGSNTIVVFHCSACLLQDFCNLL